MIVSERNSHCRADQCRFISPALGKMSLSLVLGVMVETFPKRNRSQDRHRKSIDQCQQVFVARDQRVGFGGDGIRRARPPYVPRQKNKTALGRVS